MAHASEHRCPCLKRPFPRVSKDTFHQGGHWNRSTTHEYLILFFLTSIVLLNFPTTANAFWLPPDYWVTIYKNGQIEPGRTQRDFIDFPDLASVYIGYWINNTQKHQEAYGHVFPIAEGPSTRFCGHFADVWTDSSRYLCGGFRVLAYKLGTQRPCPNPFTFVNASIANPFMAVEYLDTQIARVQLDNGRWVYGGARMAERSGFAADPRGGPLIRIIFDGDRKAYAERVQILQRSWAFPTEDLLEDSSPFAAHPRPQFPPIPAVMPPAPKETTTTSTTPKTTTSSTTAVPPMKQLQQVKEETNAPVEIQITTTTAAPLPTDVAEDFDDELSGAGIEWGALFTGNGIEEVEAGKRLIRELPRKRRSHRHRRHHFRRRINQ